MDSSSWDLLATQLAVAFQFVCLVVFALLLSSSWVRGRSARCLMGVSVASVLLLIQPLVYRSPTQPYGMMLSSMSFAAALSLLHWAFLEARHGRPSINEVVMSPTLHGINGVVKVHKRMQRHHGHKAHRQPNEDGTPHMKLRSSDNKPLVVVEAAPDDDSEAHEARSRVLWALLEAVLVAVEVILLYDVGFFLLCKVARDMCAGGAVTASSHAAPSWLPARLAAVLQHPSVKLTLFSFAAGNLLPLLMEFLYSSTRLMMLAAALVWPGASDEAVHWPAKIFNQPLAANSITSLWSFRWHQMLRFYFEGLCNRAVDALLPKGKAVPPALRGSAKVVAAFTLSGAMHEYQLWAAFGSLSGWNMAFFAAHCAVVLLENWVPAVAKALLSPKKPRGAHKAHHHGGGSPRHHDAARPHGGRSSGGGSFVRSPVLHRVRVILKAGLAHVWALSVMALLSPLFMEPYRVAGTFGHRAFHPLGFPLTPHVVGYAQKLLPASAPAVLAL